MIGRRLPPVHSPLTARAIFDGAAALWGLGGVATAAEHAVVAHLRAAFAPRDLLRTDSGTTALTLALTSLARRHPGRPVALPAYCCYDLATAADGARVPVVLYDLDPATLGPDERSLRHALAAGAAGVVIVHLYGVPVDVDAVTAIAQEHGAEVIDDAAQGVGATYHGKPVGAFGSFGVLSFGRGKGLTGSGGGALLGNDAIGAGELRVLAAELPPGRRGGAAALIAAKAQWLLARPAWYGLPSRLPFLHLGETIYRSPARPARASAVNAAILAATWPLAAAESATRRRHADRLLASLSGSRQSWAVRVPAGGVAGYLRLPLVPAERRLSAKLGILPGYPKALIDLEGFGARTLTPEAPYSGARLLADRLCTLPTHSLLGEDDLRRLERWLASAPE
jgi:perosamine synthetase